VLRAELTINCADDVPTAHSVRDASGEIRIDDDKLLWRLDEKSTVHIAPAD